MIDRYVFLQKKIDVDRPGFTTHWRDVHGPIAAKISSLRKYVQYNVQDGRTDIKFPVGDLLIDGFALLAFDDLPAIGRGFTPELIEELGADEQKFISGLDLLTTVPLSIVSLPGNGPLVGAVRLLKRQDEVSIRAFQEKWQGEYANKVGSIPGILGFQQSIVIEHGFGGGSVETPVDGVEIAYFRTLDEFNTAMDSATWSDAEAAGKAFSNEMLRMVVGVTDIV
jgi:uncharacterized protein (TIGR02118 family)